MLNFAEQTGSGAVIVVWSFLLIELVLGYIKRSYNKIKGLCPLKRGRWITVHEVRVDERWANGILSEQ
jgi:hypothetical protein